jgi:hypothetical protein
MKAIKWLMMQHAPLILRPKVDMAMIVLDAADAAQLHLRPLCDQQKPDAAAGRLQPHLAGGAARRDRHCL